MERDMAKDKRGAWERDVEKMRQIIAAQGDLSHLHIFHPLVCRWSIVVRACDLVVKLELTVLMFLLFY